MSDITVNAAFISIGIMMGALIISLIVAKICDHIYDRRSLRDDASDISEHTRGLIRARLAVMKFMKPKERTPKEKEEKAKESARKVFRVWSAKSARSRIARRKRAESENKDMEGQATDAKEPSSITFVNEQATANGGKTVTTGGDKNKQSKLLTVPTLTVSDVSDMDDDVPAKTGVSAGGSSTKTTTTAPAPTTTTTTTSKNVTAKKSSSVAPAPASVVATTTAVKAAGQVKADQPAASKGKDDKAKDQKAKEDKAKEDKAKEEKLKEEKAKEEKAKEEKAKQEKAKEEKAKEEKAKEEKAKEEKAKEEKAKEEKTKEGKAKEEKATDEKAKDNKGKESAAKGDTTTQQKGKEQTTKGEATAAAGGAKGGKADDNARTPEPLKKFEVERITGRISPTKSAGSRGTPVMSPRAAGLSVSASVESQRSTPQTSRTAQEVLVSLREELKDKGKDPGVSFVQFRVNTDDLLLPVRNEDDGPAPVEQQPKAHATLSRTSSADYEFLAEDQKAAVKGGDKDKAKS